MNKLTKITGIIGMALLCSAFLSGGLATAQMAAPNGPSNGADGTADGNLIGINFPAGTTDVWAFFSTRIPVTLYGKCGYFYADDMDVVRSNAFFFGKHMKLFFKGIYELGLYSMDALDVEIKKECNNEGGYKTDIYFSVRQDQVLWDCYGNPYYVKKNDVAKYDVDDGKIDILFRGDMYVCPRVDGVSYVKLLGHKALYLSTAEDWLFNSPDGMFYVQDEDIVCIPLNGAAEAGFEYEIVFRGKEHGLTTLDAFDYHLAWLYISVRNPVLIQWPSQWPPFAVYAEDGDMVCLDWITNHIWWIYKGEKSFISSIDGLAVESKLTEPE